MKLLVLNDEEHSLLQNILNNFVLHGVESIPNDDSCNVLKMNDRINELKDVEPVVYASEKDIQDLKIFTYLFAEKQSYDPVNIPLYRLDK